MTKKENLFDNIKYVFTDFDGSLSQHDQTLLKGSDKLFKKIVKNGGNIILLTNRSTEACLSDERVFKNFGKNGVWYNKDNHHFKVAVVAATGALFLDQEFKLIEEFSHFLTIEQRKLISNALKIYLKDLSLIEWIERDNESKIINTIKKITPLTRFTKTVPEDKVRKFHITFGEKKYEQEVHMRSRINRKEYEHIIRQKKANDFKRIRIIEYIRRTPYDWYLKRTKFVARPKDILRILKDEKKDISKIVLGFKTKDPDKLIKLHQEFSEKLNTSKTGLVVQPDLANLHIMNNIDKASAVKLLCNIYNVNLEKSTMIGNSEIDIPVGLMVAMNDGLYVYVGKDGENKREIKKRFIDEFNNPLLNKNYIDIDYMQLKKLITNRKILFHNPQIDINEIE